jgi:glycosyltransferase involved in cell wall biosynthesis
MTAPAPNQTDRPLVTVVLATLNRRPFLERSLKHLLAQDYPNLECLVMDGCSKDGTVQMLQAMARENPRLRFVSEPDKGEVDAVNKGLKIARGKIIGFHASDEYYMPGAISAAVEFLLAHPEFAGVSGDAIFIDEHGNVMNRGMITYRGRMARDTIRRLIVMRCETSPLVHGCFFGWADRILKTGPLNPEFSVIPDFEFYLRLLESGERIGCLPRVQIHYTVHSDMGAEKFWRKVQLQRKALYERHGWTWRHEILRRSVGRAASYLCNPYRTPLLPGLARELKQWSARRGTAG